MIHALPPLHTFLGYLIPGSWLLLKYALIGIVLLLVVLYLRQSYRNNCNATRTIWFTDPGEYDSRVIYGKLSSTMAPRHILWTGGYDSTFLLCYYFIVRQEPVQPVYLMCGHMDSNLGIIGRQNQGKELETIKRIRRRLIEKYPEQTGLLYPTIYVTTVKKNNSTTQAFQKLHRINKYFSRDISQYERIARFSLDWPHPLLIGLEKCGTGLDEATSGYRLNEGNWEHCKIAPSAILPTNQKELWSVFNNLRFPICHLTKEDMKRISLDSRNYFYDMLLDSWSCWYPTNTGQPCGQCPMCIARII